MSSTIGGDDPAHDLDPDEKDRFERELRKSARELVGRDIRRRRRLLAQANEVSREKSKRAHQK
jgi:hypothetical protein